MVKHEGGLRLPGERRPGNTTRNGCGLILHGETAGEYNHNILINYLAAPTPPTPKTKMWAEQNWLIPFMPFFKTAV